MLKHSPFALLLGTALAFSDHGPVWCQQPAKPMLDLSAQRGRTGWKGPLEEWYWLIGNPRRIAPGFWYGADPFTTAALRGNAQTKAALYDTGPARLHYEKGSRPLLEEVAREVAKGCKTDRERAAALLRWVYQMRTEPPGKTKRFVPRLPEQLPAEVDAAEHVIKEGGGSCEWVTRLFIALAQVADLPVRIVLRMVHTQAEVYLDGRWELFDPLMGDHGEKFLNQPAGKFAGKSALDIYKSSDAKEEFAIARTFLGEQRQRHWLDLKPAPGKPQRPFEGPLGKPALGETFAGAALPLKPVPPPPPPTNLFMTHGKWLVKEGRARVEFAKGYFFHLSQAVTGEENWKDVGIGAAIWRDAKAPSPLTPLPQGEGIGVRGLAGVVFRARGQNYNAALLADEDAVVVLRIEDGWKVRVLGWFPFPLTGEGPTKLYVDCRGDSAAVWLDGRCLGQVQQGLWPEGRVGLAAVQTASFDDFKVWLKPAAPPAQPAAKMLAATEDFSVADVLEWDRLLLDVPVPAAQCQPEYSIDAGKTWQSVPADHRLNEVDTRPGRIRFRLRLPPDAGAVRLGVAYRNSKALRPRP
jgi:hypothetical protein